MCRCPAVRGSYANLLKCLKVANATDQSRLISERWDDVSPPLPPVPSGKMGSKQNGEGVRVSVVFGVNAPEVYIS